MSFGTQTAAVNAGGAQGGSILGPDCCRPQK